MFSRKDTKNTKLLIWISSITRWSLGLVFSVIGYGFRKEDGGFFVIVFGLVLIVTGFLRPRRCVDDRSCDMER